MKKTLLKILILLINFIKIFKANSKASQWVSAFRKVIVNSITRTIQIEFIGAPSAYCFEEYEIRLKDETGFELLRTATIPVAHMYTEITNNKAVLFGKYIFTNLQVFSIFYIKILEFCMIQLFVQIVLYKYKFESWKEK